MDILQETLNELDRQRKVGVRGQKEWAEDTVTGFEEGGRDHEFFGGLVCLFWAALGLSLRLAGSFNWSGVFSLVALCRLHIAVASLVAERRL